MITNRSKGFTLIELMVSIALFSFVMVIASAAYLNLVNLDAQTRANNDLTTNLSFVADTMARGIRTGFDYQCGGAGGTNCAITPNSTFTYSDQDSGETITYELSGGAILECPGSNACQAITDPRITISTLSFYVSGVGNTDNVQPHVVIVIQGSIPSEAGNTTNFSLQTSATQRATDI